MGQVWTFSGTPNFQQVTLTTHFLMMCNPLHGLQSLDEPSLYPTQKEFSVKHYLLEPILKQTATIFAENYEG